MIIIKNIFNNCDTVNDDDNDDNGESIRFQVLGFPTSFKEYF